jgi:uncharacterized RDD family membrane protein YckC
MPHHEIQYAGFMRRLAATIIDSLLFTLLAAVILAAMYVLHTPEYLREQNNLQLIANFLNGSTSNDLHGLLLNYLLPFLLTLLFWIRLSATPGKLLLNCFVVDARTGKAITGRQAVLRYLGYLASTLPLFLGFLWIVRHPKKQGFHDLIAKTMVIMDADDLSTLSLEQLAGDYL